MIPENREQALAIVLAAAQTRVDHRRSGSHDPMPPLAMKGLNKLTESEIERSIALLRGTK